MQPSRFSIQAFGVCLVLLGGWISYHALAAITGYFHTGSIVWGSSSRRATGETALLFHGICLLAGCWLVAKGGYSFATGRDPEA
ncbi:hypothetical protein [Lysobacter sp. HA35]